MFLLKTRNGSKFNCEVCRVLSRMQCNGCKSVYYCSPEHQKAHWNEHKTFCITKGRLKIDRIQNEYGFHRRVLIAADNFKKHDIIFTEAPLLYGPNEVLVTPEDFVEAPQRGTSCIVCHQFLEPKPDKRYPCAVCNWPICCDECRQYHTQLECEILGGAISKGFTEIVPPWKFILILRAWVYKKIRPKSFGILMELEGHPKLQEEDWQPDLWSSASEEIQIPAVIQHHRLLIRDVTKLLRHYKVDEFTNDERLVDAVIQVIEWNAMAMTMLTHEDYHQNIARNGIYPILSAASQSCMPNVMTILRPDKKLACIATRNIQAGDEIQANKCASRTLGDTFHRKLWLSSRFLDCKCKRCTDPTELGTYHSAVKCNMFPEEKIIGCRVGNVLPYKTYDPETFGEDCPYIWKCDTCGRERDERTMTEFFAAMSVEKRMALEPTEIKSLTIKSLEKHLLSKTSVSKMKGVGKIEDFLRTYGNEIFHPNHDFIVEVKLRLCQVLSEGIREIFSLNKNEDFRKQISEAAQQIYNMTGDLLEIVTILQPDISYIQAEVVYYRQHGFGLFAPHLLMTKFRTKESKKDLKKISNNIISLRENANLVFCHYSFLKTPAGSFDRFRHMKLDGTMYDVLDQHLSDSPFGIGGMRTVHALLGQPTPEDCPALDDL